MEQQVNFIFRKRLRQYNSIEELFLNISNALRSKTKKKVQLIELPASGASPKSILKNLQSVKKRNDSIYHITGDVNYMAIRLGNRSILTIHDIQSGLTGNFIKRHIKKYLWFKWPAKKVRYITVISDFTKGELLKIIPNHSDKVVVVHNPINSSIQADLEFGFNTTKPTILLMGTKSNKNLERSFEALKDLTVHTIIIGKLSTEQKEQLVNSSISYNNYERLSYEEILDCYRKSDLLCFPSLYEGFGMPIIEAQAIGRPVLTSNLGAMKEVAGNGACLVNPFEVNEIRAAVLRIINDEDYRNDLIQIGFENVKRFSLERTIESYMSLYSKMNDENA